jgi:hypothetical protein
MLPFELNRLPKLLIASGVASALSSACHPIVSRSDRGGAAAAATAAAAAAPVNSAPAGASPPAPAPNGAARAASGPAMAAAAAAQRRRRCRPAKAFAEIVKDARYPGYLNLYAKDETIWIEIKPEQFDPPLFLQINRTRGVGERDPFSSPMLRSYIVEFHKLGHNVQMLAKNTQFFAKEGTPLARAVRESSSDSLLGAVAVVSQPHPERKSVLIEANALLLVDLPSGSTALEAAYRIPYSFDSRNSSFTGTQNTPDLTGFSVSAHYSVPKLSAPPAMGGGSSSASTPAHLEDGRSLFLGYYYSFARLPEPMQPRIADDRIGHFVSRRLDFSGDSSTFPEVYYVNRWRLEKQDSDAALSEPKKPIVYWLDRNIPEKYRETVKEGILEWNKAFEKIGFKDAIRVEIQPEDAEFTTSDARHASVRWVVRDEPGALAIGPRRVDPRTGEILDADIEIEEAWTRVARRQASEQFAPRSAAHSRTDLSICDYGDAAMDETAFAMDILAARGEIEPDGPEAEKFVLATLKDVVTHEVGHTLGLQHNFRASTIYTQKQLADPGFTKEHGIGGSVMDYNAINLALRDEPQGDYVMHSIGPYDYWAIEYAYKPIAPAEEKEELARIAARSGEPQLAFGNDVDAGFGGAAEGMDPQVNRRDLGSEPLEYATRRLKLTRELWDRLQTRQLKPGESYEMLRRNFLAGLTQFGNAGMVSAKYVGGVVYVRDHAGSGRDPFTPVPAEKQRSALRLIADGLFSVDSFRLRPDFVRRLTVDQFDRFRDDVGPSAISPDIALTSRMLSVQRAVLDQLMSDAVATRISEGEYRQTKANSGFRLSELYDTLQDSIWSELKSGREITSFRRNLQREHLRRVTAALLRPSQSVQADARALQRENAKQLLAQIRSAKSRAALSKEARAHLAECENTLEQALKAPLLRTGV